MDYQLKTHGRAKSIKIKVETDGHVVVTSPPRTSKHKIDNFVTQSRAWIASQRHQLQQKQFGVTDTEVLVFGRKYQRQLMADQNQPLGVFIRRSQLIINPPQPHQAQNELNRFLKHTAERYLRPRTHQLAKKMNLTYRRLTLRQQKTRWGSCSQQKNLNFNWRLVHYPPPIIDYVIIHELAHLVHLNHSAQFWQLVSRYDPAYRQHQRWLKKNGVAVIG